MSPPAARWALDTPDLVLVEAAQRGDRSALDALLRRHHDRILILCRRLCRDRGDAEDAAQNALLAIVRGLNRFDHGAAFTTWSYRVATNSCMDELRRRGRRPLPTDPTTVAGVDLPPASTPRVVDPADAAVHSELRLTIQEALDQLPDEFRHPVVLRDLADLDYAEIGEILALPPGTVRSRIARGRARLAAVLRDVDPGAATEGNQSGPSDVRVQDTP